MRILRSILSNRGTSNAEYSLLLCLIAFASLSSINFLSDSANNTFASAQIGMLSEVEEPSSVVVQQIVVASSQSAGSAQAYGGGTQTSVTDGNPLTIETETETGSQGSNRGNQRP